MNTGQAREAAWAGRLRRTAIDKRPVAGRVAVRRLGLAGDEQVDTARHGGPDQAVYAYAREDLGWWAERAGREFASGAFGENVTTAGLDITGALIGETWRLGSAVVQVTACRTPCVVFQNWLDQEQWVRRFGAAGRPGAYLRVLEAGTVGAGDPVQVVDRPAERVTVAEAMRAYYGDEDIMRRLLTVTGRGAKWDEMALSALGRVPGTGQAGEAGPAGVIRPSGAGGRGTGA